MGAAELPPGPRMPAALQTVGWLARHLPFLERVRRDLGSTFTLRFTGVGRYVFVSDAESTKELFSGDREHGLPEGRTLLLEPVLGPRSLLVLEGTEHLRRRRLMLPPFHGERMRAYEDTLVAVVAREVEGWPRDAAFPIRERTQAITLEVILRAVFGVEEGRRYEELREALTEMLEAARRVFAQALALLTRPLGQRGPYAPFQRLIDRVDGLLAAEVAERRRTANLDEREDVLSMLVGARFDDGTSMDDAELRDQLMTLLVAGHETTATALAWAFDMLLHNREVHARARAAAADGDDRYLVAVGDEAQRLRPVVPSVGRKLGVAGEYGGYEIPAEESVLVATYLLHTNPDLYEDPYEFRPERFLDSKPQTYAWLPFGGGIHRCLGAAFAELELRVVLGEVLRRVDLRPASPAAERSMLPGVTLVPIGGTRVAVAN